MHTNWDYLGSQAAYQGQIMQVRLDRYHFKPGRITRDYTVLEFGDWVNVIPLTAEGQVVLIRQWRHGVRQTCLEIPGGMIDAADASPAAAAARELEEETGYVARELIQLGTVQANPAIQNNLCHTFLALDAEPRGTLNFDPTELIELELTSQAETMALLRDGTIGNALVVAAFAHLLLYQQFKPTD